MAYRKIQSDLPYELREKVDGQFVCDMSGAQLRDLIDHLVEDGQYDRDYWFEPATLDFLAQRGVDARLLFEIRTALGTRAGFELEWRERRSSDRSS